jgi:1-acyl-sn-glycerol-3-phosphate acyltransferase
MRFLQHRRRAPGRSFVYVMTIWSGVSSAVLLALKLAYRVKRVGAERVPARGPLVFVANHQSHLDPTIVGVLVRDRPFTALARSTLFRFRPFAMLIRLLRALPIQRGRGDRAAFQGMLDELEAGRCVLMFPEGTRSADGTIGVFQPGVLRIVRRSGATVVPVAVEGAYDIWPKVRSLPRLTGRVAVAAGEPIPATTIIDGSAQESLARLAAVVDRLRLQLRAELRRSSGGRYPASGPGDGGPEGGTEGLRD